MIELLLKPYVFEILLAVGAVATIVVGFYLEKTKVLMGRDALMLKVSGPVTVLLYGILVGLQTVIGFSSVWTLVIFFLVSIGLGVAAGIYGLKEEPKTSNKS